jgi:hypothetical protein
VRTSEKNVKHFLQHVEFIASRTNGSFRQHRGPVYTVTKISRGGAYRLPHVNTWCEIGASSSYEKY